ncbi:hypothetical protein L6Q96_06565 [Candidatus Binatia bacterium]|nr:hypothetical protein [Candidatus Binatia bacterium]
MPARVDAALRRRAKQEDKSLNEVVIEALLQATGLAGERIRRRDLSDLAGTWADDPECEAELEAQDRVDVELWK